MGSGKTFLAKRIAVTLPRVIIFDSLWDMEWGGIQVCGNPREMAKAASRHKPFRIHYCASDVHHAPGKAFYVPGLDFCSSAAWQAQDCVLIVDEAHIVCSPHSITQYFNKLIRLGRNHRVSIVWISHNFSGVSRILTLNTTRFVFFRNHEAIELKAIAAKCGQEVADKVRGLRRNAEGIAPERLEYDCASGDYQII